MKKACDRVFFKRSKERSGREVKMKRNGSRNILAGLAAALILAGCFFSVGVNAKNADAAEETAAETESQSADGAAAGEAQLIDESVAAEANLSGSLMMLAEDTPARENPDEEAAVVVELPAGAQLLVTGEEDGWYEIFYQGKTAYVPMASATASTQVDQEALDEEMHRVEEEGAAFVEALEAQRKAAQRSRIWQIIIIVLIVAVFLTGVVSAVKSAKAEDRKDAGKRTRGKEEKQNK